MTSAFLRHISLLATCFLECNLPAAIHCSFCRCCSVATIVTSPHQPTVSELHTRRLAMKFIQFLYNDTENYSPPTPPPPPRFKRHLLPLFPTAPTDILLTHHYHSPSILGELQTPQMRCIGFSLMKVHTGHCHGFPPLSSSLVD